MNMFDGPTYSKKIDAIIYGNDCTCLNEFTEAEWRELAIACLDQGGVSERVQKEIKNKLTSLYGEYV